MSRSERVLAVGLVLACALGGCAQLVGMEDVLVVDETSAADGGRPSRTRSESTDAAAAPEASNEAEGEATSELAVDAGASTADAGSLQCSGVVAPRCADPYAPRDGSRNYPCADTCECAAGLYCRPSSPQYSPVGICCRNGPCGASCASACDCGSGLCVAGRCR